MRSKEYCQQCEKETMHEVERTGRVTEQHGHGHNDEVEYYYECQKCYHGYRQI